MLGSIARAVSHIYQGRVTECIKEAFKIIEGKYSVKDYSKYKCIRDILSHKEPELFQETISNFDKYFGRPNSFDLKQFDLNKRIIIIDFESDKTKRTLNKLARELIEEGKIILKL
jgi:hypothetical protein